MSHQLRWILALICNSAVVIWMGILLVRKIKEKDPMFFRFFTTLSNLFAMAGCAVMIPFCLCACVSGHADVPHWVTMFKYVSAVSVCVTFLTVIFFLGPVNGYDKLLGGNGFYVHLTGPLLSVLSCCLLERGGWSFSEGFFGMLPTLIYGTVYFIQVIIRKKWDDFYGFNRGGHWKIAVIGMLGGTALICIGMTLLAN